jgi:hypothetical protein
MKEVKEKNPKDSKDVPERPIPSQAEGDEETIDESLRQKEKKDS